MDKTNRGGDAVGDDVGGKKAGDVVGGKSEGVRVNEAKAKINSDIKENYECKICGTFSKSMYAQKKHLSKNHSEFAISIATTFNQKNIQKPQKLNKCESCGRNFFFLETWKRHVRNCHIDMSIIGGGEENTINNLEGESDSEPDDIENDEVTKTSKLIKNSFCIEKQWGDDDENPSGINFKSKLPHFKKLVELLRNVFRKGSVKAIGKIKTYAEKVKRKNTGTEVKINITDPEIKIKEILFGKKRKKGIKK